MRHRPTSRTRSAALALAVLAVVGSLSGAVPATAGVPSDGRYLPFDLPQEVVDTAYQDVLGRAPSAAERSAGVDDVAAGRTTAARLRTALHRSGEFDRFVAPTTRLYRAYYLRDPDQSGLRYWVGRVRAGYGLRNASDFFARSSEFVRRYGSVTDAEFVDLVYLNVMGRRPDAGGRSYWAGQLAAGTKTRGDVMIGFSESSEYTRRTEADLLVATAFLSTLGRRASDGERTDWLAAVASGTTDAGLVTELTRTEEFERRITLLSNGGPATAWTHISPANPGRWNPCSAIRWSLNPNGAPAHAVDDIEEAMRRVSAATGLEFTRVGDTTTYVPWRGSDYFAGYPAGVDLVIAYSTEATIPDLRGGVVGLGGSARIPRTGSHDQLVQGGITLDRVGTETAGFVTYHGHGNVFMHELGHAVGLGHAPDERQLMNPYINPDNGRRFGAGDLAGFADVGDGRGCLSPTRSLDLSRPIAVPPLP